MPNITLPYIFMCIYIIYFHFLYRLQRKTKIPYNKMIFFDDLQWNIKEVKSLGVHSHHVPNGVHTGAFRKALKEYERFWSCK